MTIASALDSMAAAIYSSSLEFQLQHHSFQRNPRAGLLQNGLVGSPCSPRDSQESSPPPHFWGLQKSLHMVTVALKLRLLLLARKAMTNLDSIFKSRDSTLPTKVRLVKAVVFSCGHVWM